MHKVEQNWKNDSENLSFTDKHKIILAVGYEKNTSTNKAWSPENAAKRVSEFLIKHTWDMRQGDMQHLPVRVEPTLACDCQQHATPTSTVLSGAEERPGWNFI